MAMMEINWNPSGKLLKDFGRIAAVACAILAALLYWLRGLPLPWAGAIAGVGVAIFLVSLVSLRVTRWIFLGLTLVTFPIGLVASFMILAIFYFGILTPLALFFRLIGRDPLHRRWDPQTQSYWVEHQKTDDMKRYFRQS